MPAPTLISYAETVWNTTGASKSLPAASWTAGDLIVIASLTEDFACVASVANQFGLTFASTTTGTSGSTCFAGVWVATASSNQTSVAVAATSADGGVNTHMWGLGLWVFRGHGGAGTPVVDKTTAKTISLTRAAANSIVVSAQGDYSAASSSGYSFTPALSGGNDRQHAALVNYTAYVADWGDQGSTGTTSYGTTGETSTGTFAKVAVEVKGTAAVAGGGVVPARPGQTWLRRFHHRQQPQPAAVSATTDGLVTGIAGQVTASGGAGAISADANITGAAAPVTAAGGAGTVHAGAGITGIAASVTVSGGAGTVSATQPVTGIAAPVTVQGGAGVAFGSNPNANVTGVAASVTVNGGAGITGGGAGVTGVAAQVTVNGGAGTVKAGIALTGTGASVTVNGGAGTVSAAASITGTGASVTVNGGVGVAAGAGGGAANIAGVAAQVTVTGGAGAASSAVSITGTAGHVTAAGATGTVSATQPVTGIAAHVTASGGAGVFAGAANITGLAAPVTVSGAAGQLAAAARVQGLAALTSVLGGAGTAAGFTPPPPFTIGALTAADKAQASLTAGQAASTLGAVSAPAGGTLTAGDQRTGGPGG